MTASPELTEEAATKRPSADGLLGRDTLGTADSRRIVTDVAAAAGGVVELVIPYQLARLEGEGGLVDHHHRDGPAGPQ